MGLAAVVPCIRSSDYELVQKCPFLYYLKRRLGLVKALSWSKARNRGSWLHTRMQYLHAPKPDRDHACAQALAARNLELEGVCREFGIVGDSARGIIEREVQDFQTVEAWFNTIMTLALPGTPSTLLGYLSHMRPLATELRLSTTLETFKPVIPFVAQLDGLYYHPVQEQVWIADWKTCTEPAYIRLSTCTIEFQTLHYMMVVRDLLKTGALQKRFGLPATTTLGGMIHFAVQKPTIEMGMNDRSRTWVSIGKRTGITAQAKPEGQTWRCTSIVAETGEKVGEFLTNREDTAQEWCQQQTGKKAEPSYSGEPVHGMYVRRVVDWYKGEGEYSHLTEKRKPGTTHDLSLTSARVLDADTVREYTQRARVIHDYATRVADPDQFYRSSSHLRPPAPADDRAYSRFYFEPVHKWPDIVAEEHFMQIHRDEDTPTEE